MAKGARFTNRRGDLVLKLDFGYIPFKANQLKQKTRPTCGAFIKHCDTPIQGPALNAKAIVFYIER